MFNPFELFESDEYIENEDLNEFVTLVVSGSEHLHPFDFTGLLCTMIYNYAEQRNLGPRGCGNIINAIRSSMIDLKTGETLEPPKGENK